MFWDDPRGPPTTDGSDDVEDVLRVDGRRGDGAGGGALRFATKQMPDARTKMGKLVITISFLTKTENLK